VADFYPLEESNGLVFKWYLNGDLVSDDEAPSLELEEGTTNEVMLETTNPAGCTHSTTREVIVQDGIEIPSAFSPNGDGKNESFRIRIEEELESFNIKIFDRWGQLHFESNDKNFEWFGIGNSSNQPINSYSYILKAKTVTGKDIKKTGTITVITTN
jgi:gliding motility-associated-like protein